MKIKTRVLYLVIASLSLGGCKKEKDDIYNKETILKFSEDIGYSSTSVNGVINELLGIDNFNITNYPADSASFNCYLKTYDANTKCFIELYDLTNNKVINNTLLTSNSIAIEFKITTVNFINEFPKTAIKLGCRIRSEKEGTFVLITKPELRLYRK